MKFLKHGLIPLLAFAAISYTPAWWWIASPLLEWGINEDWITAAQGLITIAVAGWFLLIVAARLRSLGLPDYLCVIVIYACNEIAGGFESTVAAAWVRIVMLGGGILLLLAIRGDEKAKADGN